MKFVANWALPMILVGVIFVVINSQTYASPAPPKKAELEEYLEDNVLEIGAESVDGYQQIYYVYDDIKIFITKNTNNHTQPSISGKYVTWVETIDGFPQIVLYDLLEKTELKITQTGTNVSPSISDNKIVWEGLSGGVQQVFYYDGYRIHQLSYDYTSLRPKIKEDTAVFAQYTGEQDKPWRVMSYDLERIDQPNSPDEEPADKIIKEGYEPDSWPSFTEKGVKTTL